MNLVRKEDNFKSLISLSTPSLGRKLYTEKNYLLKSLQNPLFLFSPQNIINMGLFRRNKNNNKPILGQILNLVPHWLFKSCTNTYKTDKGVSKYRTYNQFVALTFGQLNKCQSLNDISAGIRISEIFIKDLGLAQSPVRSTMSDGNKKRDWRVFESLYYRLLSHYKSVLKQHHKTIYYKRDQGQGY